VARQIDDEEPRERLHRARTYTTLAAG
jgi:hypothetical protein